LVNKPKSQGTAFETWLVNSINTSLHPIGEARRIAEGGSNDEGDITFMDGFNQPWVIEAKATQTLNATRVLGKAREKGGKYTVLIWKRLTKLKEGQLKRRPDGEPLVVVMAYDVWLELMRRENL
jgi:hypothetical protein